MLKTKRSIASPEAIAIFIATINLIVFCLILVNSPEELIAQYIPDDGYYYLTLARNFATLHFWTFDSGASVTSGFHILFAYLLTLLFSIFQPDSYQFIIASVILNLFFTSAAIVTLWRWSAKNNRELFILFIALIVSGKNFVYNTASITEWPMTILIAGAYYGYFFGNYGKSIDWKQILIFCALGLLGSLSRTDFGLLPFSIFISTIIFFKAVSKSQFLFALSGLLGALSGVAFSFLHNFIFTGEFIQSSAQVKAYWAGLAKPIYYAVPILIGEILNNAGLATLGILLLLALILKFNKRPILQQAPNSKKDGDAPYVEKRTTWLLLASALICISGYTLFYANNADVQPWYTANLLIPSLSLLFLISDYLTNAIYDQYKKIIQIIFFAALFLNLGSLYPLSFSKSPWAHQKFMFLAGKYLAQHKTNCKVGSWNAGIIGYYEGGRVINLDGLVNNAVYPYIISNNLPKYISEKNICYIVDFEYLLTDPQLRIRGGYNNPAFISTLIPELSFDEDKSIQSYLTLYHIR
ncbi:MAG: hypothetical protein IT310_02310 [Anaerolineales bacterium]|nr:hypothetical protein [Anaerolineales bacterium]